MYEENQIYRLNQLILNWLKKYAYGRENAKPREWLLKYLKLFPEFENLTDRTLRETYSKLPVCSCENGLYIPKSRKDIEEFKEYMRKKAIPILARWKIVAQAYPHLIEKGEQLKLLEV